MMKKRMSQAMLGAVVALAALPAPALAHSGRVQPRLVSCRLTLSVAHMPPAGTSLWVVYGPPAPWFGMARMHATSSGTYSAVVKLPAGSRARFTYLAGKGAIRTAHGSVPGNPVITVRATAPMTIGPRALPEVRWSGPTG